MIKGPFIFFSIQAFSAFDPLANNINQTDIMKRQRLTPRAEYRKNNKSLSPQNVQPKNKNKESNQTQRKPGKQNQPLNDKQENALKICLDLANHHRKEAQDLKIKNQILQQRLQDQLSDMEKLKKQLSNIKTNLHSTQLAKKENQDSKSQVLSLRKQKEKLNYEISALNSKINELNQENKQLKQKKQQSQSVLLVAQSKCENYDINTLTLAKQSRRQQYANNYESFTFVPSTVCLQCSRKENELQQVKEKYCIQLRKLQEQVIQLQRNQTAIQLMENQMITKNECIDYLVKQLYRLQTHSTGILEGVEALQAKIQKIKANNALDYKSQKLQHSYPRSLQ